MIIRASVTMVVLCQSWVVAQEVTPEDIVNAMRCPDIIEVIFGWGAGYAEGDSREEAILDAAWYAMLAACDKANERADEFLTHAAFCIDEYGEDGCIRTEVWWEWCGHQAILDIPITDSAILLGCARRGTERYDDLNEEFGGEATSRWLCKATAHAFVDAYVTCDPEDS